MGGTIITITREATKTGTEIMKTIGGIEDTREMKTTVDTIPGTDISVYKEVKCNVISKKNVLSCMIVVFELGNRMILSHEISSQLKNPCGDSQRKTFNNTFLWCIHCP